MKIFVRLLSNISWRFLIVVLAISDAASAFASGSSPTSAISISDEFDASEDAVIDLEDLEIGKMLDVNSAIAVEKEVAADTIGTLFAATRAHFLPYVENSVLQLIVLLGHYYEGIRKSATDSLLEVVRTFYDLSDHDEWESGKDHVGWLALSLTLLLTDCNSHS